MQTTIAVRVYSRISVPTQSYQSVDFRYPVNAHRAPNGGRPHYARRRIKQCPRLNRKPDLGRSQPPGKKAKKINSHPLSSRKWTSRSLAGGKFVSME
ncbi:hypothetical protein EVAR_97913_1 [Eumeta japonica]|uniref:Uncharacterized protein n=1 Tax=Eumeta variegata TaxID=151549 RepID=A0A4C2A6Z0_EUMVA|nr:hypothetical protein EVAR_97913_1 [Eumeta japonica]